MHTPRCGWGEPPRLPGVGVEGTVGVPLLQLSLPCQTLRSGVPYWEGNGVPAVPGGAGRR